MSSRNENSFDKHDVCAILAVGEGRQSSRSNKEGKMEDAKKPDLDLDEKPVKEKRPAYDYYYEEEDEF